MGMNMKLVTVKGAMYAIFEEGVDLLKITEGTITIAASSLSASAHKEHFKSSWPTPFEARPQNPKQLSYDGYVPVSRTVSDAQRTQDFYRYLGLAGLNKF